MFHIFKKRWVINCSMGVASILLAIIWGTFDVDESISNSWEDYSYGNLQSRIDNINLPLTYGNLMIFKSKENGRLVPLENYYETCHFDDIGYQLLGQIMVKCTGIQMDGNTLARIHNFIFVLGIIILSFEIFWLWGSYRSLISLPLLLVLHSGIKPLLYSSVSQHSLLTVLPLLFMLILIPLIKLRGRNSWGVYIFLLWSGGMVGLFWLIRNPFGKASLMVLLLLLIMEKRVSGTKLVLSKISAFIGGFILITIIFTGIVGLVRDIEQGWYDGDLTKYLGLPQGHTTFYTLMAGIGRYENPLGLKYNDGVLDKYLIGVMKGDGAMEDGTPYKFLFDNYAKREFFNYLRKYPFKYLNYLLKGTLEMFWVVPAISFQHGDTFYGIPAQPINGKDRVEKRDIMPELNGGLLTVKFRYLELKWYQWLIYMISIGILVYTFFVSIFKKRVLLYDHGNGLLILGLCVMGVLLFIPRVLIPIWGQDFVIFYWISTVLSLVFIVRDVKFPVFPKKIVRRYK